MPLIDLSEPQSEFSDCKSSDVAVVSGFGAGKTEGIIADIFQNLWLYPNNNFGYFAPTLGLVKSIFYPRVTEILLQIGFKNKKDFSINRQDHEISIRGLGKIFCRTMDNPDMIVGYELFKSYIDEIDILPELKAENAYRKISARTRQKPRKPNGDLYKKKIARKFHPNQKKIATTPEGFKFTYKYFKKNPIKKSRLIQMSTYSNKKNLPKGYIKDLKKQYTKELIKAYIDGKFVNLTSGTVYYTFDRDVHHCKFKGLKSNQPIHVGMDFNVYKMAAVIATATEKQKTTEKGIPLIGKKYTQLHIFDEIVNGRDTQDVCDILKERYPDRQIVIYPDPAGQHGSSKGASLTDVRILKDNGFKVKVMSSHPLVRDRVLSVNTSYEKRYVVMDTKKCPNLTEATEQQIYVNGVPDKSTDIDHPLDAKGYMIYTFNPVVNHVVQTARLR